MKIEIEREEDGRWIAEVNDLPGVLAYGKTRDKAIAKVEALALRVIADRLDHGESIPELDELFALPSYRLADQKRYCRFSSRSFTDRIS